MKLIKFVIDGRVKLKNFVLSMKTLKNMKNLLIVVILSLISFSCEKEELTVSTPPEDNLVINLNLRNKLSRITQYETSVDNIIDNTNCFAVNFPYTITVNNQTLTLEDESDYQTVKNIIDEDDSDSDIVSFSFPITVTYYDYSVQTFANIQELNTAIAGCVSSQELACMQFNYPLGIKTYDSQNILGETFSIASKKGLFELLKELDNYDAVTFNYPLLFTTPNNATVTLTNNQELDTTINNFISDCNTVVDPDPDFNDIITQGSWYVSYFFRDTDQTDDYEIYDFVFDGGGTVSVTGESSPIGGTWVSFNDDSELKVIFVFSSSNLEELQEDWTITEVTQNVVKMEHISGGGDDIRKLHFTKN